MDESDDIFISSGDIKFKIKKTPENGNCFFYAAAYLLGLIGIFIHHAPLRSEVVRYATENWENFKDFTTGYETSEGYVTDRDSYASYMGSDLTYAKRCELEVLAQRFSLNIKVYNYLTGRLVDWYGKLENQTFCLLVSGKDDRKHFDAITEIDKPTDAKEDIELQILKSYMDDNFVTPNRKFRIIRVPGDGNCFFHSASHLLIKTGLHINPQDLRQQVVQYVVENWELYQPYSFGYETEEGMLTGPESYAAYMGKNCTYAGEIELDAVANKYSIYIRVYNSSNKDIMTYYGDPENSEVNLLFTGNISSGHYDALEADDIQQKLDLSLLTSVFQQKQPHKRGREEKGDEDDEPEKKRYRSSSGDSRCRMS